MYLPFTLFLIEPEMVAPVENEIIIKKKNRFNCFIQPLLDQ